ncbi:MAG: CinA family protein, partial [Candidatus Planktophila sp.]
MPTSAHARLIIEHLQKRGETVAIAESLTAGGVGHALTQIPGASTVFLGGVIAYTSEAKINFLGVSKQSIEEHTVVSEEVA